MSQPMDPMRDPNANDPHAAQNPFPAANGPSWQGSPNPGQQGHAGPQGYPGQQGYAGQQGYPGQQGYAGQAPMGDPQALQGPGSWSDVPPPGTKGVYTGPITGQPITESDAKLWALLAQLSIIVLGFIGPLVVYLMYKDRNRFVRFYAAEALSGAIVSAVAVFAITIVTVIIAIVTLGIGSVLIFLVGIPPLIQTIFAIIAAVKSNNREWWPYPVNLRLFT